MCHLIYPAGTRHGEVFRLELSPSILELCDRAATKVVWVTVSVAARSGNIVVPPRYYLASEGYMLNCKM